MGKGGPEGQVSERQRGNRGWDKAKQDREQTGGLCRVLFFLLRVAVNTSWPLLARFDARVRG